MYKLVCGCVKWVSLCFQRVIVGLHVEYNAAILGLSECVESMSHFYNDMLPFRTFVHFTGKLWCVKECKPSYIIYIYIHIHIILQVKYFKSFFSHNLMVVM